MLKHILKIVIKLQNSVDLLSEVYFQIGQLQVHKVKLDFNIRLSLQITKFTVQYINW